MARGHPDRTHSYAIMITSKPRKIFVNLPVRDLDASKQFFTALGFGFNPQFTDDKAACMVVGDDGFVMLLREEFFRTFTERSLCDTESNTEALFAVTCENREEVDDLMQRALAAGGTVAGEPMTCDDYMYGCRFYDLDGHHWELFWMDPAAMRSQGSHGGVASNDD